MSRLERAARLLDRTGLNRLLLRAPSWSGVLVLNYHRIGDATGSCYDRSGWSTPEGLDEQLELILKHFDVISLDELEEVRSQGFSTSPASRWDEIAWMVRNSALSWSRAADGSAALWPSMNRSARGRCDRYRRLPRRHRG